MEASRIPMTRQGYEKLKAEIDRLQNEVMVEAEKRVAKARAEGDLRENAEYHAARESLALIQEKLAQLYEKLRRAYIVEVEESPPDVVAMGRKVVLRDLETDELETYTLVGLGEENYAEGKILVSSPLAQAILGKRKGDQVSFQAPMGMIHLEIVDVLPADGST
ncbi:MAG: transcription elongation factor GreA [Thermoguttaceae bacterium]|nr:transcription elongation factor GreA [Thermoguttaceae bacterium]MDW8078841.1 transcription elongation factor GreA [Thermoguttaceae bacterium]